MAREAGPSIVQSFHESMARQGGKLYAVIADVCAFANTNGGTIYIGVSADSTALPVGVSNIGESIEILRTEIARSINPPLEVEIDAQETSGKSVIRIQVPRGTDVQYAIDDNKIYVRDEAETSLAVRDEIVRLVLNRAQRGAAPLEGFDFRSGLRPASAPGSEPRRCSERHPGEPPGRPATIHRAL
jgi:predicted HTH transcriptional regulator